MSAGARYFGPMLIQQLTSGTVVNVGNVSGIVRDDDGRWIVYPIAGETFRITEDDAREIGAMYPKPIYAAG